MSILHFNTLTQVDRLEKVGLRREQAEAIVQNQQEMYEHAVLNTLATKSDLSELGAHLRLEMSDMKTDIIKWVAGMLVAQAAVVSTLVKLL